MKKIWKMRKNREAVSPVIATILMVAITVVLAAVLYVMVMGFGTSSSDPTGSFVGSADNQTAGYKLTLGVITPETTWNDCKLSLSVNGVAMTAASIVMPSGVGTSASAITLGTSGAKAYTAWVTDLNADGKISNGDSISVRAALGFPTSGDYDLALIFSNSGGQITHKAWSV
jgi:flagellin-like protein